MHESRAMKHLHHLHTSYIPKNVGNLKGQEPLFKMARQGQFGRSLQSITLTCPTVTGLLFLQSLGQTADLNLQIQGDGDLQEWAQNWTSSLLGSWVTAMEAQRAEKGKIKTLRHAQD